MDAPRSPCSCSRRRFQRVRLSGTVEGEPSQQDLDRLAAEAERRCIVASTLKASGRSLGAWGWFSQ